LILLEFIFQIERQKIK